MDDMTAFERQVERRIHRFVGPARLVDDLAIYASVTATTRSPRWGFTMFSALKFIAAAVIVALFGGFLLAGVLTTQQGDEVLPAAVTESPSPMTSEEPAFPTGTFVEADSGYSPRLIFRGDGTFQTSIVGTHGAEGTYAVDGDLYTEMTTNSEKPGANVPATYRWHWDGTDHPEARRGSRDRVDVGRLGAG